MDVSLPKFPDTFKDLLLKSWITYKKLFIYFFLFIASLHLLTAAVFFGFISNQNLLIQIHFVDASRFFISKMSDAFVCFLLPLFLQNKLTEPISIIKKFLKDYFALLASTILLLYFLLKQIPSFNILLLMIGLALSFYLLFVICFIIIEKDKRLPENFKSSFKLVHIFRSKVFAYFLSCFFLLNGIQVILEIGLFFSEIKTALQQFTAINDAQIIEFQKWFAEIIKSPKFYIVNSLLHLFFQPFISLFVVILFYSLYQKINTSSVKKFFSNVTS